MLRETTVPVLVTPADAGDAVVIDALMRSGAGSPPLGPRMGSVTYRVLCQAPVLTLALPPEWQPSASIN